MISWLEVSVYEYGYSEIYNSFSSVTVEAGEGEVLTNSTSEALTRISNETARITEGGRTVNNGGNNQVTPLNSTVINSRSITTTTVQEDRYESFTYPTETFEYNVVSTKTSTAETTLTSFNPEGTATYTDSILTVTFGNITIIGIRPVPPEENENEDEGGGGVGNAILIRGIALTEIEETTAGNLFHTIYEADSEYAGFDSVIFGPIETDVSFSNAGYDGEATTAYRTTLEGIGTTVPIVKFNNRRPTSLPPLTFPTLTIAEFSIELTYRNRVLDSIAPYTDVFLASIPHRTTEYEAGRAIYRTEQSESRFTFWAERTVLQQGNYGTGTISFRSIAAREEVNTDGLSYDVIYFPRATTTILSTTAARVGTYAQGNADALGTRGETLDISGSSTGAVGDASYAMGIARYNPVWVMARPQYCYGPDGQIGKYYTEGEEFSFLLIVDPIRYFAAGAINATIFPATNETYTAYNNSITYTTKGQNEITTSSTIIRPVEGTNDPIVWSTREFLVGGLLTEGESATIAIASGAYVNELNETTFYPEDVNETYEFPEERSTSYLYPIRYFGERGAFGDNVISFVARNGDAARHATVVMQDVIFNEDYDSVYDGLMNPADERNILKFID